MLTRLMCFHADYAAAIDDDRLEDWPDFFAEDGRYRVTTRRNHAEGLPAGLIYTDSRAMLRDRVRSLRQANVYERQTYRHLVGMPRIVSDEGEPLRAETPFSVMRTVRDGASELFVCGRYLDEFLDDGRRLCLSRRDVVCDGSRIETLLALPL